MEYKTQKQTNEGDIRSGYDGGFPYKIMNAVCEFFSPMERTNRKSVEDKFPEIELKDSRN